MDISKDATGKVSSASTAPIQSRITTEFTYVVPKKRGHGRLIIKKLIPKPVIVEQKVLPQEANDEEVSASLDNGTTITRRRRRETSLSSKSDNNDGISGLKRKRKQAAKVPWYRRRRLLSIEALPVDDQRA